MRCIGMTTYWAIVGPGYRNYTWYCLLCVKTAFVGGSKVALKAFNTALLSLMSLTPLIATITHSRERYMRCTLQGQEKAHDLGFSFNQTILSYNTTSLMPLGSTSPPFFFLKQREHKLQHIFSSLLFILLR